MQIFNHNYKNIHKIFDDIDRAYKVLSERKHEYKSLFPVTFDYSFEYLIDLFKEFGECVVNVDFNNAGYEKIKLPNFNTKNIIVCFSGGKDSLAAALYYRKRGYKVHLFHVANINHVIGEYDAVQKFADWLNMPLHIETVQVDGKRDWVEHPMKNIMIASAALNYGISHEITSKIAFGNFYTSRIEDEQFDISGDDSIDMWIAFENIISRVIPRFKMHIGLKNVQSSFNLVYKKENSDIFEDIYSCVGAHRFNKYNHDRIENKYQIKLWKNRCGCCWKCAYEYIWCCDNGLLSYNKGYYGYCLKILRETLKKETGIVYNDDKELWRYYFFYDMRKSRYFIA